MKRFLRRLYNRYVLEDWKIAIADYDSKLNVDNIKWLKHNYKDRWFADPFIVDETDTEYIILVEECMYENLKGRIARLTVTKDDCTLVRNETILDLQTHLSFPNTITLGGGVFLYPENGKAGNTKYYEYGKTLKECGILSDLPFADAVIVKHDAYYYCLFTIGGCSSGNLLHVYRSQSPLEGYSPYQEIAFEDNIARRAGNVFWLDGRLISPAQVCNNRYGEGISFQELTFHDGKMTLKEIKRSFPPTKKYPYGFHTFNVFNNKVAIDGYRYNKLLRNLYFKTAQFVSAKK